MKYKALNVVQLYPGIWIPQEGIKTTDKTDRKLFPVTEFTDTEVLVNIPFTDETLTLSLLLSNEERRKEVARELTLRAKKIGISKLLRVVTNNSSLSGETEKLSIKEIINAGSSTESMVFTNRVMLAVTYGGANWCIDLTTEYLNITGTAVVRSETVGNNIKHYIEVPVEWLWLFNISKQ